MVVVHGQRLCAACTIRLAFNSGGDQAEVHQMRQLFRGIHSYPYASEAVRRG